MPTTRSNKTYAPPLPSTASAELPDVGPLPFDALAISEGEITSTSYGRPGRLPWNFFKSLVGRWSREGWAKFLLSAPGIHDGLDADAEWIPRWALGKGSQGQIALFVKFNAAGAIEDQMVIKEAFGATHDQLYDYGVLREAVFHGHLTAMKQSINTIIGLRGYRFYPHHTDTTQDKARLYMQYAEYNTLETIWNRYRAWATYLPELFLWTVFEDLCRACIAMNTCPNTWQPFWSLGPVPALFAQNEDNIILHGDIKMQNCFMQERRNDKTGKPLKRKKPLACPATTLGTAGWYPPECVKYSQNWDNELYGYIDDTFRFDERTNVFGIGRIVFALMTLGDYDQFPLPEQMPVGTEQTPFDRHEEQAYFDKDSHVLTEEEMRPLERNDDPAATGPGREMYSRDLVELVHDCLNPSIAMRPSSEDVLERIRISLEDCRKAAEASLPKVAKGASRKRRNEQERLRKAAEKEHEVVLTNAEMNSRRQRGNAPIKFDFDNVIDRTFFSEVTQGQVMVMGNPEEPLLQPPEEVFDQQFFGDGFREAAVRGAGALGMPAEDDLDVLLMLEDRADWIARVGEWAYIAKKGSNSEPKCKRVRSWTPADESDFDTRSDLIDLRQRTRTFTESLPFALLEYVYTSEKQDVAAAADYLRWMYDDDHQSKPAWATKPKIVQMADTICKDWDQRFSDRARTPTKKECLYFARQYVSSKVGISVATNVFASLLKDPTDEDDDAPASGDHSPPDGEELRKCIRQLQARLGQHMFDGVVDYNCIYYPYASQFLEVLLERNKRSVAETFRFMVDEELVKASPDTQAHMVTGRALYGSQLSLKTCLEQFKLFLVANCKSGEDNLLSDTDTLQAALCKANFDASEALQELVEQGKVEEKDDVSESEPDEGTEPDYR